MSTLFALAVFGGLLVVQLLLAAICLRIVAPRLGAVNASPRRCLSAALAMCVVGLAATAAQVAVPEDSAPLLLGLVCAAVGLNGFINARLLAMSFGKGLIAWLSIVLTGLPMLGIVLLVVRPYALEAFVAATNSMAPTILGEHWTGTCPECGAPAYGSPLAAGESMPPDGLLMICDRELRARNVVDAPQEASPGDRFLVNKLLAPKRWDLVVYRDPTDPSTVYVKRLVGLPGESLVIRDGAVWINDEKQIPNGPAAGLHYDTTFNPPLSLTVWGSPEHPATLAHDEFFVLGDFSARSRDSRLWEASAPGHPPYALPESHIVGVVTHIYWPPHRWRVFR